MHILERHTTTENDIDADGYPAFRLVKSASYRIIREYADGKPLFSKTFNGYACNLCDKLFSGTFAKHDCLDHVKNCTGPAEKPVRPDFTKYRKLEIKFDAWMYKLREQFDYHPERHPHKARSVEDEKRRIAAREREVDAIMKQFEKTVFERERSYWQLMAYAFCQMDWDRLKSAIHSYGEQQRQKGIDDIGKQIEMCPGVPDAVKDALFAWFDKDDVLTEIVGELDPRRLADPGKN